MLWIILCMLSVSSLSAFTAAVTRTLGSPQPGDANGAVGPRLARAVGADQPPMAAPRPAPFEPGLSLRPTPGPAAPFDPGSGLRLPRGSLLDLSV